ncbi:MAG: tRNA preQ1(34) S-adenosylmethionine ribosyltransferase-isomerase QueA [Erysipelothrix sp.]|nr:tRNA preQ1(34) S-adenosylmethionine ribosyltransferase-isomerase QueA [Erysipelothrix sp.]
MKTSDFDYHLPEQLIAQNPTDRRDMSRFMHVNVKNQSFSHLHFSDIINVLRPNDVLVLNNTKVIPARLYGIKSETNAKVELLILKLQGQQAQCMVKKAKVVKVGTIIEFQHPDLKAECIEVQEDGLRLFKFISNRPILEMLYLVGTMPLPPYIKNSHATMDRYQTVYAKNEGSSAAPTAGLHFTPELIGALKAKGITFVELTLHIGLGTFKPVEVDDVSHHKMHSESYYISEESAKIISTAKENSQRIIAVGTTSARTLESVMQKHGKIRQDEGDTDIFITPGYQFKAIDGLITNFHLPKSTLMMMVTALGGYDLLMRAYQEAVKLEYRFFSFGDSMFIDLG